MKEISRKEVFTATLKYFNGAILPTETWIDKYCLKNQGKLYELSPDDMHKRLAKEFARIELKYPNPMSEDEIYHLLKDFKYIVPQGSPMTGIGNNFAIASISNCLVVGGHVDSYGGIHKADEEQSQLMKRRCGVGQDISWLRPSGSLAGATPLGENAGTTLYMKRFSNTTREVQQDGRRGALMLTIDIGHPDAEKFIDKKMTPGEVTGANVSVKITDAYMKALEENVPFYQTFPIEHSIANVANNEDLDKLKEGKLYQGPKIDGIKTYYKKVDPKKLWKKIVHNAWAAAEPGTLFWDHIIRESPARGYGEDWKEVSTNPCFTRETLVATADGRGHVSFSQLAKDGLDVEVYCSNEAGDLVIRTMRNPRRTGTSQQIYKVTLDNGESLRVTGNHKFYLRDRSKVAVKNLKKGDSLHIMSKIFEDTNSNRQIVLNSNGGSIPEHRFILDKKSLTKKGYDIHHKDEDPYNNELGNLMVLTKAEHNAIHHKAYLGLSNGNASTLTNEDIQKIAASATKKKGYRITTNDFIKEGGLNLNKYRLNKLNCKTVSEFYLEVADSVFNNKKLVFGDLKTIAKYVRENPEFENHKIESIEKDGVEDVFNGTVDEYHNYFVGGFEEISRGGYRKQVSCLVANCGEIPLPKDDSCRLLVLNLYSYLFNAFKSDAMLEDTLLVDHVKKAQRLMDDIVDLEIEKIDAILADIDTKTYDDKFQQVERELWLKIRKKARDGRRTGLGITGEGDLIAGLGYTYGTPEATKFAESLHQLIATAAYESSIELAEERGAFPIWDWDRDMSSDFIRRMFGYRNELMNSISTGKYFQFGRRNVAVLTIAPTGTVSIMTQTSSGIEPVFAPYYFRKKKITNQTEWDYEDEDGDKWVEFPVFHKPFIDWYATHAKVDFNIARYQLENLPKEDLDRLFKVSPYYKATAQDVDYIEKVRMQGAVQKWVDHSISVTVNMPEGATEEVVAAVYLEAFKSKCKGITVYRDNCRGNVLSTTSIKKVQETEDFEHVAGVKRPSSLSCDIFFKSANKDPYILLVGIFQGKPYEMFTMPYNKDTKFSKGIKSGAIVKIKKGRYDLVGDNDISIIEDITSHMIESEKNTTRLISALLRHRTDPKYVADIIDKFAIINSFHKVAGKVLRSYTKIGGGGVPCPSCETGEMIMTEGCMKCKECGYAHCG